MFESDSQTQKPSEGNTETSEGEKSLKKYRAFCFADFRENPVVMDGQIRYLCYAPELCPTTGKHHWQTYIYFNNQKTIKQAVKYIGCGVDIARGTPLENKTYIQGPYDKDNKHKPYNTEFKEFGDLPRQGVQRDVEALCKDIANGRTIESIVLEDPYAYHMYSKTLLYTQKVISGKNRYIKDVEVLWYHGPTGTGKTYKAFTENPEAVFIKYTGNFFTDWYDAKTVILDDYRGEIPYNELLRFLDKYRNTNEVNIKYGSKYVDLDKIIITCSMPPEKCYPRQNEKDDSINQLLRRITKIIYTG